MHLIRSLGNEYIRLFSDSFSEKKNAKFINGIKVTFIKIKIHLLKLF